MSLYTSMAANLIFPLHERLKGHSTTAAFRSLEKSQWLPPDELRKLQRENLRQFLTDIGTRVPYYRDLFQRLGFNPSSLSSLEDLQKLPLTGKPEMRANTEALKAEGATQLQRFNTGGSSGEPLVFYLGKERVSHDVAAKRRATRWWGVDIGDPEIVVWGSPIELGAQDRVRMLRDKLFRTKLLSAFEMSESNLQRFVNEIRAYKPRMLFGYPSSLALIAAHADKNNISLNDIGIQVAFVTSERLYDHQRSSIEQTFGCPVANGYGGRDAGFIAHQCPEGSMHITAEDMVVEVVNENGEVLPEGEKGEIVITHMRTSEFPFVRYRTGDVGVLSNEICACGRSLSILAEIEGRTTDFIIAADGTVIHGLALIYVLRDMPEIDAFKIMQEAIGKLTVEIVTSSGERGEIENEVKQQFCARLGEPLEIDFHYLSEIQREVSGKFRYVVSRVALSPREK